MVDSPSAHGYEPSGFFVLRTPLLPLDELLHHAERLDAPRATSDRGALEQALARDRAKLRSHLQALVARPEVREALFLASPEVVEALPVWREAPDGRAGRRLERTLQRYVSRMAGRATPFGLFAGWSVGEVGSATHLGLNGLSGYRRHTRLDSHTLSLLVQAIQGDPTLRRGLIFRPNSSLYEFGGSYRYVECRVQQEERTYHLVAVEASDALRSTLQRAQPGAPLEPLTSALVADETTRSEAEAYIGELVQGQILVADLEPPVTGPEPIPDLVAQLRTEASTRHIAVLLDEVRAELEEMDRCGLTVEPHRYRKIVDRLTSVPIKLDPRRLFQVDMEKPAAQVSLGPAVVEELIQGVGLLHRLAPSRRDGLERFRAAFRKRYGLREVPLVEALDEDGGIGFELSAGSGAGDSPLLRGLPLPTGDTASTHAGWTARDDVLGRRVEDCLRRNSLEMTLQDEDLGDLEVEASHPVPDAFAVIATVAAKSDEACERGEFSVFLQVASGPSGAILLGRFCHADPRLRQHVERHLRAEEALRPAATFAEIVHLPEGRVGNILLRPALREFEIPFLGRSGRPAEKQLPVTDLQVRVNGDRIVLRSLRLGCEVVPRLTSAHAFSRAGLGVYRFLCLLQRAGTTGSLTWDWGALSKLSFLPRVRTGRLVLALAQWRLGRREIESLLQGDDTERYGNVQGLRDARGLPRLVAIVQAGSRLLIDLDNVLSVDVLLHLLQRRTEALLVEFFPGVDELPARGPEGRFVHELILPLLRKPSGGQADPVTHSRVPGEAAPQLRRYVPGSEWLYARLYAGPAAIDRILRDVVAPLVRTCRSAGWVKRWFFIRYADPDWHIRLRFQGDPDPLWSSLLPALRAATAPLLADGRSWRLELDTYERELERYGGAEGLSLSEAFFQIDSEAALALLPLVSGDDRVDDRWRVTLLGLDLLLADFGLDLRRRCSMMESALVSPLEARPSRPLKHGLGERYRQVRKELDALFERAASRDAGTLAEPIQVLRRRSQEGASTIASLHRAHRAGRLERGVEAIALSYLHLFVNRMIRSDHASHELVLYDFLRRRYESELARQPGRR